MFLLIFVTVNIKTVILRKVRSSNAGMETCAPLINAIANNALLHSNSHIKQMPPQIIHILYAFSGRLAAPDFVMKCIEARADRVSYIIALSD